MLLAFNMYKHWKICEIFWIALFRDLFKESLRTTSSLTYNNWIFICGPGALMSVHYGYNSMSIIFLKSILKFFYMPNRIWSYSVQSIFFFLVDLVFNAISRKRRKLADRVHGTDMTTVFSNFGMFLLLS